jgi:hypothetical protein
MNRFLSKVVSTGSAMAAAVQMAAISGQVMALELTDQQIDPGQGFANDIGGVINAVLSFVMVIAALLVLMYLVWGGIEWITSGGDKGKTESARNKITAAVIGLIILAASYAIFLLVLRFIGFNSTDELFNVQSIGEASN